ncbi:MAG: ribonuclease [Methanolobus sp.]|jgi:ribonuclease HII|uniref:Ribonuclease HII n=1 Tax=Methanolobus tindarius DSM 2278 TaxID=1090322 RepID=W9DNU2_METTI|nr:MULTISPECIES: ribonuclease HII [Methanolobus]ETA66670.1 RNase HII [Methanolobus tindarius DSM 2278]MDK2831087.1 ribonuclease [Methanolobus sp.]
MKIAGLDEAGKGPVIGPMCIGGVMLDDAKESTLRNLGVADSKKISPKKRVQLAGQIEKYSEKVFVLEVSAEQIDELRTLMSMNDIMVVAFSKVLEQLHPETAYADAADVNEERFGFRLLEEYRKNNPEKADNLTIISKHKADASYPIVSAASIVAKVRRDQLIEDLKAEHDVDFGSGYPSDPKTKKFLAEWYGENGELPDFVRHSWKTVENVIKNAEAENQQE